MKKKLIGISVTIAVLLALCILLLFLIYHGVIILNAAASRNYPVKGVDVSAYQGNIDWKDLSAQGISFAFIKATEGSSFVDSQFDRNFREASKTSLAVGAYHFFSYDSPGQTQAEHFIDTVIPFEGMLPPVIDLEFYGDKEQNPPTRADVEWELKAMLRMLEEHYHQKPIIYATEKSYALYLSNDYRDYDIWIRNVISKPKLSDQRSWTFWQYTNRERLPGYQGDEHYIDVNVFYGSPEDFAAYLHNNAYKAQKKTGSNFSADTQRLHFLLNHAIIDTKPGIYSPFSVIFTLKVIHARRNFDEKVWYHCNHCLCSSVCRHFSVDYVTGSHDGF